MQNTFKRNYCILGHIDHGKSTLSDRLIEFTGALTQRQMRKQVLDQMELEQERGITIKAAAVHLEYKAKDNQIYQLNLIDTPGHVDFSYEVSRSLAACEGAILIVDAAQGVQAQTLANAYLAIDQDLEIIPVINKIDLPHAEPENVKMQIEEIIGIPADEVILCSAKEGIGTEEILEAIVDRISPPKGNSSHRLKALLIDSFYDSYRGVVMYLRVFDGEINKGDSIQLMSNGSVHEVEELGVFIPSMFSVDRLEAGSVGYLMANVKDVKLAGVGDTITHAHRPTAEALPGYREMMSVVFCGLYPTENVEFSTLRTALEKLQLNDSSFTFEPENSIALGSGFRCGFLGLLHMEVTQERLEREFDLTLLRTPPSAKYQVFLRDGESIEIDNPAQLPPLGEIEHIKEPYIRAELIVPQDCIGIAMELCQKRRGIFSDMNSLDGTRTQIVYEIPLSEVLTDFHDRLKSSTRGYGSFQYELSDYKISKLVRLDILLNGDVVDALSIIIHKDSAYRHGRELATKLRKLIPRQQFDIPVQAAIGSKVIARETIKALRKNVTAKCYGGDITRKRKLLEKQKEGKKRMKQIGTVPVPQEAFMAVLSIGEE